VTCHAAGSIDPNGGESLEFGVMIHKIHAGGELPSIAGADGIVWDNPATTVDESADNGQYAIWGYQNRKSTWWKAEFPAVLANCDKCHTGSGTEVANWKAKPSRKLCGSCHDDINFASGTSHSGGVVTDDTMCATCHPAAGATGPARFPVETEHAFTTKDPRNISEYDATLTVSTPANGKYFVKGEAPVVTIVLSNGGVPIDHTTVIEDNDGAEGCLTTGCPAGDGKFSAANFFVHGPRAKEMPVLTTRARAAVVGSGVGPFDLSAASASLILTVDNGQTTTVFDSTGGDSTAAANLTITVASGTAANSCGTTPCIASAAAATAQEIVNWLNANAAFKLRAIAYLDQGRPAIRSRNLGNYYAVQLAASNVATQVFAGDVTMHFINASTPSNVISKRTSAANEDPKVTRTVDSITYTLDPVDDLKPGTYVAGIEMSDRGRISDTNYRTPTVARVAFQVGQATEEKLVAGNCQSCHQSADEDGAGVGFVLDYARHNKVFNSTATDQCGECHDQLPQNATGSTFSGAVPISKRVHAVHFGSDLNFPIATVAHTDTVPGRNWDIKFPQDIRNCQSCHSEDTSGTWQTKAARLPCMGCHDSPAATAHMQIQTFDPTPANPWSGDEQESCQTCH
jgi:predicted CXXCH cytochrome family protein